MALNRYPDARVNDLRKALADYAQMPEGFDIMLGNGSDELISLLALACAQPGATVLAPLQPIEEAPREITAYELVADREASAQISAGPNP